MSKHKCPLGVKGVPDNPPIIVWRFKDAPEDLRELSENGGDEDWLAVVPSCLRKEYIGWLEGMGFDSCSEPEIHKLADGSIVYIGAHA